MTTILTTLAVLTILSGLSLLLAVYAHHHVAWPFTFPWRVRRAMVHVGLVRRIPKAPDEKPKLRRKSHKGQLWTLVWKMPAGIHSGKVDANRQALEEHLDAAIEVYPERGKLVMRLGRETIPDELHLRELSLPTGGELRVILGASRMGPLSVDIAEVPHLLIGGTSSAGKSALVQSMVVQLVRAKSPAELQLVFSDLKGGVDAAVFDALPHLRWPVAGRHEEAAAHLVELVQEQEARQDMIRGHVANLGEWNRRYPDRRLPYIVAVIDEFADLLPKDAATKEERVAREAAWAAVSSLTRMGRASGIHVLIATQRPDADVLPGQIRANCNVKIALACATEFNSYIMLGQGNAAATKLPSRADGKPWPGRCIYQWGRRELECQAAYMPAAEIEAEVAKLRELYAPRPGLATGSVIALQGAGEV